MVLPAPLGPTKGYQLPGFHPETNMFQRVSARLAVVEFLDLFYRLRPLKVTVDTESMLP